MGRNHLSLVLVKARPGADVAEVCRAIAERTGLLALRKEEFCWSTMSYYLGRTGIPINFGITVALGFVVGAAIAGQTFYLFTVENLKQFGALKAMGVSNARLVGMSLLQALVVGAVGYGLGVGGAALYGVITPAVVVTVPPAFNMTPTILWISAAAVLVIVLLASLVSIRRVLVLEPAVVFK